MRSSKTKIALDKHQPKTLIISGGVSANSYIRKKFQTEFSKRVKEILIPPKKLSTDNAVGTGIVGAIRKLS